MNPNLNQILSIVRWLLSVGGPLGAYLVSRGVPADQVTALQNIGQLKQDWTAA